MTIRGLAWLGGLWFLVLARPCQADDPYQVIRQFGLLGSWSTNCDDDTGATLIARFAMSSLSLPRVIVGQPDVILYSAVVSAARVIGTDEISLNLTSVLGLPAQVLTLRMRGGNLQYLQAGGDWSQPMKLCVSE